MSALKSRRALQITLGVITAIPFASGLAAIIGGPESLPGRVGEVSATVDSEYRFVNAYWLAVAPIGWASMPYVERRTVLIQTLLGLAVAGGLARLLSLRAKGRPHPMMLGALGIELGVVPALMVWQAAVARAAAEALIGGETTA